MSTKKKEETKMTTESAIKAIIFDVDGVLIEYKPLLTKDGTSVEGNSWYQLTEGLGCLVEEHIELYRQGRAGELDWHQAERKLVSMYKASGNATRDFITNLCASHSLRPEARDVVEYLKDKGYITCLISGSFDIHVEATATLLGIEHWYANATLIFDQTGNLEKIIYHGDQNQIKVGQLEEFCQKVGISPTECVFVGDSDNDIGVFQATSHGIAVHCDDDYLKGIAWKDCKTLSEIKSIL